jgi:hypothetical protein
MSARSNIQEKLKEWSAQSLLSGQGDEAHDARFYYTNSLDCLLAAVSKAAVADGIDRQTLMKLFLRHADEVSAG